MRRVFAQCVAMLAVLLTFYAIVFAVVLVWGYEEVVIQNGSWEMHLAAWGYAIFWPVLILFIAVVLLGFLAVVILSIFDFPAIKEHDK